MASRLKDRGKVAIPSRPITPRPTMPRDKSTGRRTPSSTAAAGKENSLALSGAKPGKPSPAAAAAAGAAVRSSTSSIPRGRAPNPSDFSKLLSTLRGGGVEQNAAAAARRLSGRAITKDLEAEAGLRRSVSGAIGVPEKGRRSVGCVSRVPELKKGSGVGFGDDIGRKKEGFDAKVKRIDPKRENLDVKVKQIDPKKAADVAILEEMPKTAASSVANVSKVSSSSQKMANRAEDVKDGNGSDNNIIPVFTVHVMDSKDAANDGRDQKEDFLESDEPKQQQEGGKLAEKIKVFEKVMSDEGKTVKASSGVNRYPSRLHEKLASLEGRVQKIATEIKKTKEMLDENNPDEPKLILSNIQKEITAIEKAISHVKDDNKVQLGTSDSSDTESLQTRKTKKWTVAKSGDPKRAAKGLNNEELEARFFPHHKLLRDRRSLTASQQESSAVPNRDSGRKMEVAHANPRDDEDSIAMEFLASLDGEENEFFKDRKAKNMAKGRIFESTDASSKSSSQGSSKNLVGRNSKEEVELLATEKIEDFDEQENKSTMLLQEGTDESSDVQLWGIGNKSSTGGWFVSEGEAVLLAHGDGTCSYYDIANSEFKTEYKPPAAVSHNMWGDCWLIRALGVDGCSGRYVVAASAGTSLDSGFCCWDYYSKEVKACHVEEESSQSSFVSSSRTVLAPLPNLGSSRATSAMSEAERQQWWYRPCGPLLLSTASKQKMVRAYDIRDGDQVMKWEVSNPVVGMEYSSPLQWRSKGKVVIAGTESIMLWDVNSLTPQPLISVGSAGKKVYCLHVNNTDAEVGGGVRQRVSSSEVEGNDGVFSTQESVNVFDFRLPAGVGLKIARNGGTANSIFSRGDSVFIGITEGRLQIKGGLRSRVQHYSLRKGKLVATYELPDSNSHFHHSSITQVWGNSNLVMAACGMGLFVFDAFKDDGKQSYSFDRGNTIGVREGIGPNDLYRPTFDYLSPRVLLVSRDRPAHWRYLS